MNERNGQSGRGDLDEWKKREEQEERESEGPTLEEIKAKEVPRFRELPLGKEFLARQRRNLAVRLLLGLLLLGGAAAFALLSDFPSLRYPKSPGVGLVVLACLVVVRILRVPALLFDGNWVGIVEEVGLKSVIGAGYLGRPTERQAFYMTIRKENGDYTDYLNFETVGKRPSEVEASSGMVRRVETPRVSVMGTGAARREDENNRGMDGAMNRFGTSAPYALGDFVIHLRGQRYLSTYGKSKDSFAICPFCGEIVIPERTRCYRCGAPLVK